MGSTQILRNSQITLPNPHLNSLSKITTTNKKIDSNSIPTMSEIMEASKAQKIHLQLQTLGPFFRITAESLETQNELGRAEGLIRVWFGGRVLHLDFIRLRRETLGMERSIFGVGLFIGAVAIRYGYMSVVVGQLSCLPSMTLSFTIPRYYSDEWLHEDQNRVPPHREEEVTRERNKCFKRYFEDITERTKVITEFGKFSGYVEAFSEYDSIHNRWHMDPYTWWCAYGAYAPSLQKLALRLLVQPASSSCCERNWSTYSFIHSVRRNKMVPQRAEDLVFIHSNLRLLSRRSSQYLQGETKMWDIARDNFDSLDDIGMLGIANLSLDEPAMEAVLFTDEGEDGGGGGEDVVIVSST